MFVQQPISALFYADTLPPGIALLRAVTATLAHRVAPKTVRKPHAGKWKDRILTYALQVEQEASKSSPEDARRIEQHGVTWLPARIAGIEPKEQSAAARALRSLEADGSVRVKRDGQRIRAYWLTLTGRERVSNPFSNANAHEPREDGPIVAELRATAGRVRRYYDNVVDNPAARQDLENELVRAGILLRSARGELGAGRPPKHVFEIVAYATHLNLKARDFQTTLKNSPKAPHRQGRRRLRRKPPETE